MQCCAIMCQSSDTTWKALASNWKHWKVQFWVSDATVPTVVPKKQDTRGSILPKLQLVSCCASLLLHAISSSPSWTPEAKSELRSNFREVRSEPVWTGLNRFEQLQSEAQSTCLYSSPGQFQWAWDLESNFWATVQSGFPGGTGSYPVLSWILDITWDYMGIISYVLHWYSYISWQSELLWTCSLYQRTDQCASRPWHLLDSM